MKLISSLALATVLSVLLFGDTSAGRKAPELAFNIPGQGQRLLSQYRGKVVALEFILTTCPHCQAASKVMTKFQQQYGPRGFQALDLAINALDDGHTSQQADEMAETFARTYQVGFPVGYIARDPMMSFMGLSIMDRWVVPQMALIDRKGIIRYQTPASNSEEWHKVMDDNNLQQHIEELLAGGGSSTATRSAPGKRVTP